MEATGGSGWSRAQVAEWVRTREVAPLSKLVLLLIFDRAGEQEDGRWAAWPSLRTVAGEAGVESVATVRKHIAALERAGIVMREERTARDGSRRSNRLVLLMPAPAGAGGGEGEAPARREATPAGVGHFVEAPKDSIVEADASTSREMELPAVSFRGKRVPVPVVEAAVEALDYFGSKIGQERGPFDATRAPSESLKRIIGAMLAHPILVESHLRVIDAAFADPWWKDEAPGVGVVFGPRVVEQSIAKAQRGPRPPAGANGKAERDARRAASVAKLLGGGS